jgi:leader peptidase (prepilin peptidase)/N-methyltransferase
MSIIVPRSFCPYCGKTIQPWENIPLVSFALLGGRCSICKKPISLQYPLVEAITALLTLSLWLRWGLSLEFVFYLAFTSILVVSSFIDLSHMLIPEVLVLPGIALGIVLHVVEGGLVSCLAGLGLGAGLILLIRLAGGALYQREVMGFGDVELGGLIGAFLGLKYTFVAILLAALSGSLAGGAYLLFSRKGRQMPIPFGPFLSLGAILSLYVQGLNLPLLYYYL